VLQICSLVRRNQFHHAIPKPRWRVERLRPVAAKLGHPLFPAVRVHLPGMASANNSSEEFSYLHCLIAREVLDLDL
jgi:hypothetical protein